jgi:hypothetical protein
MMLLSLCSFMLLNTDWAPSCSECHPAIEPTLLHPKWPHADTSNHSVSLFFFSHWLVLVQERISVCMNEKILPSLINGVLARLCNSYSQMAADDKWQQIAHRCMPASKISLRDRRRWAVVVTAQGETEAFRRRDVPGQNWPCIPSGGVSVVNARVQWQRNKAPIETSSFSGLLESGACTCQSEPRAMSHWRNTIAKCTSVAYVQASCNVNWGYTYVRAQVRSVGSRIRRWQTRDRHRSKVKRNVYLTVQCGITVARGRASWASNNGQYKRTDRDERPSLATSDSTVTVTNDYWLSQHQRPRTLRYYMQVVYCLSMQCCRSAFSYVL